MLERCFKRRRGFLAFAAVSLLSAPVRPDELNVGPGQPFTAIQAAIDAAQPSDIVIVAPGTYKEAIDFGGKAITVKSKGDRAATIIDATGLAKTSTVSFKSGETASSVLEGFTITGGSGTPSTAGSTTLLGGGIYIASIPAVTTPPSPAVPTTPVIRNCLIKGNTANQGAGVLLKNADVGATIENCEISGNNAAAGGAGAGINISLTGTKTNPVTIKSTTIKDNIIKSGNGGGVYVSGGNQNAVISITDCTITGNICGTLATPAGDGGGLYLGTAPVVLTGGEISGNSATNGGGLVLLSQGAKSSISGTKDSYLPITNNKASAGGGALHSPSGTTEVISYIHVEGNTSGTAGGGAMLMSGGTPTFESCEFVGNTTGEDGGAFRYIASGAAGSKGKFNACLFSNNHCTGSGGAIYVSSSNALPVIISNCVFTANKSDGDGGAIYCKAPNATSIMKVFYTTIFKNQAGATASMVGGIKFDASTSTALIYDSILWGNIPLDYDSTHGAVAQIDYCDVGTVATPAAIARGSMFSLDPEFVNATAVPPDLHLKDDSQVLALGKVSTDADLKAITKDFDGNDRPGPTEFQDLGAYLVARAPVEKPLFIRGFCRQKDAALNLSAANLDITEPIFLLRWLFANPGNYAPGCQKACDADDNGKLDLNDAVYVLNYLFHSPGPAPKAPFPAKGEDTSPDTLPCDDYKTLFP
jgi:predicted outer membrane repeat protein